MQTPPSAALWSPKVQCNGFCADLALFFLDSDLDPLQAPHWSVRVRMVESPQCLLGLYLFISNQLYIQSEKILGHSALNKVDDFCHVALAINEKLTRP